MRRTRPRRRSQPSPPTQAALGWGNGANAYRSGPIGALPKPWSVTVGHSARPFVPTSACAGGGGFRGAPSAQSSTPPSRRRMTRGPPADAWATPSPPGYGLVANLPIQRGGGLAQGLGGWLYRGGVGSEAKKQVCVPKISLHFQAPVIYHLEERLLDQAQVRTPYNPLFRSFVGSFA